MHIYIYIYIYIYISWMENKLPGNSKRGGGYC